MIASINYHQIGVLSLLIDVGGTKKLTLCVVRSFVKGIILWYYPYRSTADKRKGQKIFLTSHRTPHQKYHHHGGLSAISSHCKPQHQSFLYQNMRDKHSDNTLDLQKQISKFDCSVTNNVAKRAAVPMRSLLPQTINIQEIQNLWLFPFQNYWFKL